MPEDYKRAVCNFCPSEPLCTQYRDKMWCGECEIALVCTMTEDVGVTDCDVAKKHWRESLPGKCLLAEKALAVFVQASASQHGAREGADGFVRLPDSRVLCPRCMHPTFLLSTGHDWEPFTGRKSTFQGSCDICGLDVEIDLE